MSLLLITCHGHFMHSFLRYTRTVPWTLSFVIQWFATGVINSFNNFLEVWKEFGNSFMKHLNTFKIKNTFKFHSSDHSLLRESGAHDSLPKLFESAGRLWVGISKRQQPIRRRGASNNQSWRSRYAPNIHQRSRGNEYNTILIDSTSVV